LCFPRCVNGQGRWCRFTALKIERKCPTSTVIAGLDPDLPPQTALDTQNPMP
jgi:hypothetical protein